MSKVIKVKRCFVKLCNNTNVNSPDKVFLTVPFNKDERRRQWCEAAGVSVTSNHDLYCCEDHFKLEEDMENYMRYKLMGGPVLLKKQVIPHIFNCQKDSDEAASSQEIIVKQIRESIMEKIKCGPQTLMPTQTKSDNDGACGTHSNHSMSFVQASSTFEEIESPSNSDSVTLEECAQWNNLNETENIDQLYISNSIDTSAAEDTSNKCENDREKMELEISRLQKSIYKTRVKYCTSRRKIRNMKNILAKHLNAEITKGNPSFKSLEYGEMINNLKIRFALGRQGYIAVKSIYPLPSLSILSNSVHTIDIEFGISGDLIPALQAKFSVMEKQDTDCMLCIAEIPMKIKPWHDRFTNKFYGYTTLGDLRKPGTRLVFFLLRGLNSDWKQIISVDVATNSLKGDDILKRINDVIDVARSANLNIRGIVSDMGASTISMWKSLGVEVSSHNQKTFYERNNSKVHVFADAQLLLSYLREALLRGIFVLNHTIADKENLPTGIINGGDVATLWKRHSLSLRHLQIFDMLHERLEKPVDAAIRFFDIDTAIGLESAIKKEIFESNKPLTTAWFIKLVYKWISVVDSWCAAKSITKDNVEETVAFLRNFISIVQDLELDIKGWVKLHTGLILSTTSFINLAQEIFDEDYPFLLGNRLSQSILENVLYEFKVSVGKNVAMNSLAIIKCLVLSQLMTD